MGSHLDTVPNGGGFDGTLGVLAALEALTTARTARLPDADRLAMVCFTNEEGVRFSTGMTGSRAVAGTLDPAELAAAMTPDGHRLWDVLLERGLNPADVPKAAERRPTIAAYLELHIEQGRQLEARKAPVGLVNAIAGLSIWHIHIQGQSNHAGTTRLPDRRDALLPAAPAIIEARQTMTELPDLEATVGDMHVENGASNIVPGATDYTLDIRRVDQDKIEEATRRILGVIHNPAADNRCHVEASCRKAWPRSCSTAPYSPRARRRPQQVSGAQNWTVWPGRIPAGMVADGR